MRLGVSDRVRALDPQVPTNRRQRLFRLETPVGRNTHEVTTRSRNELRRQIYMGTDALADTSRRLLARIEATRWDIRRPLDEPRHPQIEDGQPWTRVLIG
jgi:hypothetical protein